MFSSVFLGSGLLFIAMMFVGAVNTASLITLLDRPVSDTQIWFFGRDFTESLISVYAMRMAAVFTLSVSTLGLRVAAFPRWVAFAGYAAALVLLVAAGEHRVGAVASFRSGCWCSASSSCSPSHSVGMNREDSNS